MSVNPIESYGDVVYRFYANRRRRMALFCYSVVEAEELACPADLAAGYAELKAELVEGADVTARPSHSILNATYEDDLFNDWGITHFDLGDERGEVPRTKRLLFALVRAEAAYAIGFFRHGSWTEIELLEIVHRNWRDVIEHARVKGTSLPGKLTPEDHAKMRKAGETVLVQVGGDVYADWRRLRVALPVAQYDEFDVFRFAWLPLGADDSGVA